MLSLVGVLYLRYVSVSGGTHLCTTTPTSRSNRPTGNHRMDSHLMGSPNNHPMDSHPMDSHPMDSHLMDSPNNYLTDNHSHPMASHPMDNPSKHHTAFHLPRPLHHHNSPKNEAVDYGFF